MVINEIEDILQNNNLSYLMYSGGGGGEFLTSLIYEYSNIYKNNVHKPTLQQSRKDVENTSNNRYIINYPVFLNAMIDAYGMGRHNWLDLGMEAFQEQVLKCYKDYTDTYNFNTSIKQEVQLAKEFLKEKHLLRCHCCILPNTKSKVILQILDSQLWIKYARYLASIKVKLYISSFQDFLNIAWSMTQEWGDLDTSEYVLFKKNLFKLFNTMLKRDIKNVSCRVLHIIKEATFKNNYNIDVDELLNMNVVQLEELMVQVFPSASSQLHIYNDWYNQARAMENYTCYNISDSLKTEVLNELFDIDNPEFNKKLHAWHNNNLKLLSDNGVDIDPYII